MPQALGLLIGQALFSIGAPLGLVNFFAIGGGGSLLLGLGLSAASAALRPSIPTVKPSDGQAIIKDPLAVRTKSYGTMRIAGARVFADADGDNFWFVLMINHGRISEIVSWHLDDNTIEIDGSGNVTTSPYTSCDIYYHLGLPTETAYSNLVTTFGLDEMRGDGAASILVKLKNPADAASYSEQFPRGPETLIRATVNASVVWDPRDSAQDREDPSTWEFSDNSVVCWLSYLMDADGYGMPWERFEDNIAEWEAAMDVCDDDVDLWAGGTGKRYRVAGTYRLSDDPRDVSAQFASTCDGRIWQKRDGSIGISVGAYSVPTVTLGASAILGYSDLQRGQDLLNKVEGIRASFMSPVHDYREHEAEPYPDATTVLALSEDRVATLDLNWVPSDAQARRLMKRDYTRRTAEWRGTIITNIAGIQAIDERYIQVQIPELGFDESCEVQSFSLDPNTMTCTIEILAVDATIDEWDSSEESALEGDAELSLVNDAIYSKAGTALDPISEAGGSLGKTAVVLFAGATLAATPAGWTLIQSAGPTGGLATATYIKPYLDGTETSTTFGGTSGLLWCAIMDGVLTAPTYLQKSIEVSTAIPSNQTANAQAPSNYVVFAMAAGLTPAAADANSILTTRKILGGAPYYDVDFYDESQFQVNGAISGAVKMIIFGAGSRTKDIRAEFASVDLGTNALQSFIIRPGA